MLRVFASEQSAIQSVFCNSLEHMLGPQLRQAPKARSKAEVPQKTLRQAKGSPPFESPGFIGNHGENFLKLERPDPRGPERNLKSPGRP